MTVPLDWEKLHGFVLDQSNKTMKGIDTTDVDWFLRDSNVSLNKSTQQDTDTDASEQNQEPSPHLKTPTSPHLSVSNSYNNNVAKSKPSIPSIAEECSHAQLPTDAKEQPKQAETFQDYASRSSAKNPSFSRRRSSVSSAGSASSIDSSASSGGFFSKLKHRLQRSESAGNEHSSDKSGSLFNSDYSISRSRSSRSDSDKKASRSPEPVSPDTEKKEPPEFPDDPRLQDYVRFFRQNKRNDSCIKLDSVDSRHNSVSKQAPTVTQVPEQQSKIPSFLRRRSTSATVAELHHRPTTAPAATKKVHPEPTIPGMKHLKPLKHVAFHSQTFLIDPPQQIPSRHPRKGNVEVLPSGEVRVNPLTEADKEAMEKSAKGQGGGLLVGGTGALGLIEKSDEKEEELPTDSSDVVVDEHAKSLGIEKTVITPKRPYSAPVQKMALDLMYTRCCHLREILPIPAIAKQIPKGSMSPLPVLQLRNPTPTMVEIATFADFIRIAPIICISLDGVNLSYEQFKILLSAMCAKTQLEKLSLRNTPIDSEGWALLCWFLSRNKILNRLDITQCPPLSFNLLRKKKKRKPEEEAIERMKCNKENRSDMDWSLFTAALIARNGISELILTGCCITDVTVFESLMRKAVVLKTYKLGLAYNQLTPQQLQIVLDSWLPSKTATGLDLGYNDFSSTTYLKILLEFAKSDKYAEFVKSSRIGFLSLNATNLRFNEDFKLVFEKFILTLPNLRYLDMSNNPKLFGNFDTKHSKSSSEGEISSVSTEAESVDSPKCPDTTKNPESPKKMDTALETPKGPDSPKHTDKNHEGASNEYTPDSITSYFCSKLLYFKSLVCLHIENNGLSSRSLTSLLEIVPFCKTLGYLSILGNDLDIYSATTLIQCLKNSPSSVTVEGDFSKLPELFKEKIGLYYMRNMDRFFKQNIDEKMKSSVNTQKAETSLHSLTDELNAFISRKAEKKIDLESPAAKHLIERIQNYRQILKKAIGDLFFLQYKRDLSIEGKEALIRLLYVDSSLERGLQLIDASLVKKEESFTSEDLINMNRSEDQRSVLNKTTLTKVQDALAVPHDALSPVGASSVRISRPQSLTNLSNLDKEEGSAMKLSRLESKEDLFHDSSGEMIRQKLLNGNILDLDATIKELSEAEKRGVGLRDIFNDKEGNEPQDNLKEIREKLEELKKNLAEGENEQLDLNVDEECTDSPRNEKDNVNDTYDRILRQMSVSER